MIRRNLTREINMLRRLAKNENSHCLRLFEVVETVEKVYLVLEIVQGMPLSKLVQQVTESDCFEILRQLMETLDYLDQKNVAHRDIKLENIIALNRKVKLVDFGFACSTLNPINGQCGTLMYMAPELFPPGVEDFGNP